VKALFVEYRTKQMSPPTTKYPLEKRRFHNEVSGDNMSIWRKRGFSLRQ